MKQLSQQSTSEFCVSLHLDSFYINNSRAELVYYE